MGNAKAITIGEVLDVRLVLTSYGIGLTLTYMYKCSLTFITVTYFLEHLGTKRMLEL